VQNSIEMAITDPLTGLHNRRYMESHFQRSPSRPRCA
jgi:PleD family two-component response regulator